MTICQRKDKCENISLTTSDEFAVDAFALKAAHYLLKPFTQAQIDEAMKRAMVSVPESAGDFQQRYFHYMFPEGVSL